MDQLAFSLQRRNFNQKVVESSLEHIFQGTVFFLSQRYLSKTAVSIKTHCGLMNRQGGKIYFNRPGGLNKENSDYFEDRIDDSVERI